MTLQQLVHKNMVQSMKDRNTELTTLLRTVTGEFGRIGKDVSDEDAVRIIRKMNENAKGLNNEFEMRELGKFLPEMLTPIQVKTIVEDIISQLGVTSRKDMGKVMGAIKQHSDNSLIDGKIASGFVREMLN